MSRKLFYTDMGSQLEMRDSGGGVQALERYAVWKWDTNRGKHQVAEVSNDLEKLRATHGEGPLIDLANARANKDVP